jgi:hypothetical protein
MRALHNYKSTQISYLWSNNRNWIVEKMSESAEGVVEWARTWKGKTQRLIEITNADWDKQEARRGDVLKLNANVKGVRDGAESQIEIWEHDAMVATILLKNFVHRARCKEKLKAFSSTDSDWVVYGNDQVGRGSR